MTNTTKTQDIVERLRNKYAHEFTVSNDQSTYYDFSKHPLVREAADTIESLRARVAELENQLAGGEEAVAWVTEWKEGSDEFNRRVVQFGLNVPVWVTEQFEYRHHPLYKTPPTVSDAVAAALVKVEEIVCYYAQHNLARMTIDHPYKMLCEIRSIPRDTTALEEVCVKAILSWSGIKAPPTEMWDSAVRAVVQRVIRGE